MARLLRADLGAAGSGSPVHWHNDAINVAVQGAKLWTLLPPPHAVYSRRHAALDAAAFLPGGAKADAGAVHCVQRAGEVMFVPEGWGHGVLNLEASVGYAQSFNGPHKKFNDAPHHFIDGGVSATVLRPQQYM